jgi:hypothetical protein
LPSTHPLYQFLPGFNQKTSCTPHKFNNSCSFQIVLQLHYQVNCQAYVVYVHEWRCTVCLNPCRSSKLINTGNHIFTSHEAPSLRAIGTQYKSMRNLSKCYQS